MTTAPQLTDESEIKPDVHSMLVDIGRTLQEENPDVAAALKLIRPALRELTIERDNAAAVLERHKMMHADNRGVQAIMPRSPGEAWEYARMLCAVGHVPSAYREGGKKEGKPVPGLVVLGIMKAMEIGLPPQTGLGNIMPVNDRFTIWGDGAQALVHRADVIEAQGREFINPKGFDTSGDVGPDWPTDIGYRVWFKRRNVEGAYEHTYTIADSKRAKLWLNPNKKPWITDPMRMLFNRPRAFALRDGFADCLFGLTIREELDDWNDEAMVKKLPALGFLADEPDAQTKDAAAQGGADQGQA